MAKNFPTLTGQVRECNFQCWTLHSSSYLKVYFENQNSATLFFLQLVSLLCANYQGNQLNSASSAFENVWPISSKLKVEKSTFKFSIDDLCTKIRIWFFLNSRSNNIFFSAKVVKSDRSHFNTQDSAKKIIFENFRSWKYLVSLRSILNVKQGEW